jgi:hypothetical protein
MFEWARTLWEARRSEAAPAELPPEEVDRAVIVLTHFLEMPRDLLLQDGWTFSAWEDRADDVFGGWSDQAKEVLVGIPPPQTGASPATRLTFLRASASVAALNHAAAIDFRRELANPGGGRRPWWRAARRKRRDHRRYRIRRPTDATVVAGTRYIVPPDWWNPALDPAQALREEIVAAELDGIYGDPAQALVEEIFATELDATLDTLNDFIIALAHIRQDPDLVPVARGDFPARCPVLIEAIAAVENRRLTLSGGILEYEIHSLGLEAVGPIEHDDGSGRAAAELTLMQGEGQVPFFAYFELSNRALAAASAHRNTDAVATLGTAMEVLVSTAIRIGAEAGGADPATIAGAVSAPFRNQLEHHLPRYAGVRTDLTDRDNAVGGWYLVGYDLRGRVVHEGYRPTFDEVMDAVVSAVGLHDAIVDGLRVRPETEQFGEMLAG